MPVRPRSTSAAIVTLAVVGIALTGCSKKSDSPTGPGAVGINATDTACEVSKTSFPAGHVVLDITN
ncbi:peptidase M75, partial [Kitasatospora aburaviensis]